MSTWDWFKVFALKSFHQFENFRTRQAGGFILSLQKHTDKVCRARDNKMSILLSTVTQNLQTL